MSKISKVSVDSSRKPAHRKGWCWAARIISLLPAITPLVWIAAYAAAIDAVAYGIDATLGFVVFALSPLVALIAWRWHLVGGLLLTIPAGFNVCLIAVSLINGDPYGYYELDQSFVARAILPLWMAMFIGGLLHLIAWWKERVTRIGAS
jgi:hypothetical protein